MSLINQTCWVVGGVGVVGRGITRGLLQAGATVIVNSRSPARLEGLKESLGNPDRLIAVNGSLLPGDAEKTVSEALKSTPLNHVVSHGAVRWWARKSPGKFQFYEYSEGCDETYSLNIKAANKLLDMKPKDFTSASAQLASLHFSAAQQLMPQLELSGGKSSYTFVTGDSSGKPGHGRTTMGEINSHHVWGLATALRQELQDSPVVNCREIRIGVAINRPDEERKMAPRHRPISESIGDLCAGLVANATKTDDSGRLFNINEQEQLEDLIDEYSANREDGVASLPHYYCD
mmetsp:Transcript_50841/g.75349  ORF Transcript_50841/g.75349 Transcript_50841/m.75349 type:complete len:290 (+) Transcript_50841:96-965(+)